jgi:hypothetical protein
MPYKTISDKEKDLVRLSNAKSGVQSQFDPEIPRPVPKDVSRPTPPEEPRTAYRREKAMSASGPGSEYWLP